MWRIIFLIIHSGLWTSQCYAVPVTDSLLTVMTLQTADVNKNYKADSQAAEQYYKVALALRYSYEQLNDTFTGINSRKIIQQLKLQYHSEKLEKVLISRKLLLAERKLQLQYKNTRICLLLACILFTVVAGYLLFKQKNYRQQQAPQISETQRTEEVLEAMMKGEEKERKRLSGELHDGIGGALSAVQMHFSAFRNERPWLHENESYNHALKMLEDTILDVRKTAHNLAPDVLNRLGLVKALELFCKNVSRSGQLQISFYSNEVLHRLKKTLQLSIYRIVQELVNNIIRHAHATEALVQVTRHQQLLIVTVEDNGVGLEISLTPGIGLKNIEERIRVLNGQLSITSTPGNGTTIHIEFMIPAIQPVHSASLI